MSSLFYHLSRTRTVKGPPKRSWRFGEERVILECLITLRSVILCTKVLRAAESGQWLKKKEEGFCPLLFLSIIGLILDNNKDRGCVHPLSCCVTLYGCVIRILLIVAMELHHQRTNERQNSVELRKSSVDHSVGLYIVTSCDTCDTISTNLTLTDSRKQANQTYCDTNCKEFETISSKILTPR